MYISGQLFNSSIDPKYDISYSGLDGSTQSGMTSIGISAFYLSLPPSPLSMVLRPGKEAAQKSRFRCFVLASLRTSREALLYILGLPMYVLFG